MSSIDIYRLLEDKRERRMLASDVDGARAIADCVDALRTLEETGYLGTLYRTDYIVEGSDSFPVDMLRYTSSWPKDEVDARLIEDSFDGGSKRAITLTMKHRDPEPQLAADRWQSKFRWRVVRVVETIPI
ncbi:MAG TPA: hypothetical protein VLE97_10940 [Gaiellaceae bacterium]|nr:hypothetical protein [Gaiellaceae bacterium]